MEYLIVTWIIWRTCDFFMSDIENLKIWKKHFFFIYKLGIFLICEIFESMKVIKFLPW